MGIGLGEVRARTASSRRGRQDTRRFADTDKVFLGFRDLLLFVFSSLRAFIIERPLVNYFPCFVQDTDFVGNSWIRRNWLRFITALHKVVSDDVLR